MTREMDSASQGKGKHRHLRKDLSLLTAVGFRIVLQFSIAILISLGFHFTVSQSVLTLLLVGHIALDKALPLSGPQYPFLYI